MYGFCLRPRWVLSHLLVLGLVVAMVNLGLWQLRRHDQKQDFNRVVTERSEEAVAPIADVVDAADAFGDTEAVEHRRVEATGTYAADDEVLVRSRSFDGSPGSWVLTPLVGDDGTAVVVNRGWVPVVQGGGSDADGGADLVYDPPDGPVVVEGALLSTETRGRFGAIDPADGTLDTLARADLERLQQQVDYDLYPAYLRASSQEPAQTGDLPLLLEPPDLDAGPHLGYAMQWFSFSLIALVGYPLILRRVAHGRQDGRRSGAHRPPVSGNGATATDVTAAEPSLR